MRYFLTCARIAGIEPTIRRTQNHLTSCFWAVRLTQLFYLSVLFRFVRYVRFDPLWVNLSDLSELARRDGLLAPKLAGSSLYDHSRGCFKKEKVQSLAFAILGRHLVTSSPLKIRGVLGILGSS